MNQGEGKGKEHMWILFAILSAVFAAATSILAKIGIEGVNSNLATAIRTVVVLLLAWGIVFATGAQSGIGELSGRSLLFSMRSPAACCCATRMASACSTQRISCSSSGRTERR